MKIMKTKLKTVVAALLAVVMIFSCGTAALAVEEKVTPVIVVSGMASRPLVNADTGKQAFAPTGNVIALGVLEALLPTLETLVTLDGHSFDKYGADALHSIFAEIACDTNGKSINNIVAKTYPKSSNYYSDFNDAETQTNERGVVVSIAKKIGAKNVYFFNYDWRFSAIDHAEDLNKMIEKVKKERGCDKVSLVAMSMGGTVANAYLSKYGSDSIHNLVYACAAFMGVDIVDHLLTGDIELELDAILNYFVSFLTAGKEYGAANALADILDEIAQSSTFKNAGSSAKKLTNALTSNETVNAVTKALIPFAENFKNVDGVDSYLKELVKELKPSVYKKAFNTAFITFPGVWGLLSADQFDNAVKTMKKYVDLSDSFLAKVRAYNKIQQKIPSLLKEAKKNGTNVYIIGGYGYAGIPVTSASASHTDNLIDTHHESGLCVVAPYGSTLADVKKYSLSGACTNQKHSHISADQIIDARVGFFPEQTWLIKNMQHVEFSTAHESSDLMVYVATSKNLVNVYSDSRYPQFTELNRETGKLTSLTNGVVIPGTQEAKTSVLSSILREFVDFIKRFVK